MSSHKPKARTHRIVATGITAQAVRLVDESAALAAPSTRRSRLRCFAEIVRREKWKTSQWNKKKTTINHKKTITKKILNSSTLLPTFSQTQTSGPTWDGGQKSDCMQACKKNVRGKWKYLFTLDYHQLQPHLWGQLHASQYGNSLLLMKVQRSHGQLSDIGLVWRGNREKEKNTLEMGNCI